MIPKNNRDIEDDSGSDPPIQVPLPDDHSDDPCDETILNDYKELEGGSRS